VCVCVCVCVCLPPSLCLSRSVCALTPAVPIYLCARVRVSALRLSAVVVHGLGAAVVPAIELALAVQRQAPAAYVLGVHTATVRLLDDVTPLNEARAPLPIAPLRTE
jgi:hypothetical protein